MTVTAIQDTNRETCFYCEGTGEDYDEPILDCEHCAGRGWNTVEHPEIEGE